MSNLQAMLVYQETDKKLFAIERELSSCDERKEYVKAKKFLQAAAEKLESLDAKAKQCRGAAAELTKKYLAKEEMLGEFSNVDELVGGGADVSFYKKKALSLMDELKKIKADLAVLTAGVTESHDEYQKLKKQVIAMQKQYKEAQEKYDEVKTSKEAEMSAIKAELKKLSKDISAELLELYENKRKEKIFPVLGKLAEGNRCPYCSMELSLAAADKLRGGGTIECDNCHRVLYDE